MTPRATQKSNPWRKTIRLAGLAVVVVALATGWHMTWRHAAIFVGKQADSLVARSAENGRRIGCTRRRIEGYPFRIGLFCDALSFHDERAAWRIAAGALRSAAQFYKPGRLIAEIDGPLALRFAGDETGYDANWRILRSSISLSGQGLKRLSVEAEGLRVDAPAGAGIAGADIEKTELHVRPSPDGQGEDALDLAFLAEEMDLRPAQGPAWPTIAISGDLRLDAIVAHLRPGFDPAQYLRDHGIEGHIREASLRRDGSGRIEISGPFNIGSDGRLSATLNVKIADFGALARFFAETFPDSPQLTEGLEQASFLLAAMGTSRSRSIALTVDRGAVRIGFIELGEIPPLF